MPVLVKNQDKKAYVPKANVESIACFEQKSELKRAVKGFSTKKVYRFVSEQLDLQKYCKSILFCTEDQAYVDDVDFDNLRAIINLKRLNFAHDVDEHLRAINKLLPDAGIYIVRAETYWNRRHRIFKRSHLPCLLPRWASVLPPMRSSPGDFLRISSIQSIPHFT